MRARRTTSVLAAAGLTMALTVGLAACTPDGAAPPKPTVTTTSGPIKVTLAVYGPDAVISAYASIASRFSADNPGITINIKPYATHQAAMADLAKTRGTASAPDIFLAADRDLPKLMRTKSNQQVNEMLSAQNIDFGDGYERAALETFSADSALQCMPVDISPLVVYYNRALVKLETLRPDGQNPPNPEDGWRFSDFATAAKQASVGGKRGVYVAPDVDQLAPFLFSGGGQLVDDTEDPTKLTIGDGSNEDTLQEVLGLLRDPTVTYTAAQLAKRSALSRFKLGKLGMILGYRSLTPELRQQTGLDFGVMPMPRVGRSATVTETTGLCVKPKLPHRTSTARFLAYLVGDEASKVLAATGYYTPTNTAVLRTDDFEQPTLAPTGGRVFADQIRYGRPLPRTQEWKQVTPLLDTALSALLYDPVIDPLQDRLDQIDSSITPLLDGTAPSGTASPSGSPSGSSTASPSATPSG